jgi:surfeit locus 1 family protein
MKFRPSLLLTVVLLALALVFARLGYWQLQRKAEKTELFDRFENAPAMGITEALDDGRRFARVEGFGRFDGERHILLDNRMFRGRPGVNVLTPFAIEGGPVVLVNRGWLPLPPDRQSFPGIPTDESLRMIRGRLNLLRTQGPRLGEADVLVPDRWPQLVTYLDPEPLSAALGYDVPPWLVQMGADEPGGFEGRDWQAAVMEPATHGGYAVQWFALSLAAVIIWITLGVRNANAHAGNDPNPETKNEP